MREKQLSQKEFNEIRQLVAKRLQNKAQVEESEVPDGFPFPKNYVCAALARNSFVLGADNLVYRCGLQVGEKHRAVGALTGNKEHFQDNEWWEKFNPCELPSCSKCSFLPICWGGCPKKHLDNDKHSLDEQSEYWRRNLYHKLVSYVGCTPKHANLLTEADQFRSGYSI